MPTEPATGAATARACSSSRAGSITRSSCTRYRIELGDVEANLRALTGVRDAVVLPILKQGAVDSLAAFVILNEKTTQSDFQFACDLKGRMIERLPAYMVPRRFSFLESFPMNANGKADRRRLAEGARHDPVRRFPLFRHSPLHRPADVARPAVARLLARGSCWPLRGCCSSSTGPSHTSCLRAVPRALASPAAYPLRAGSPRCGRSGSWWPAASSSGSSPRPSFGSGRSPRADWPFPAALLLTLLPLIGARFLPLAIPAAQLLGFLGISYVTFRSLDVIFGIKDRLIVSLPAGQFFAFLFFFPAISSAPSTAFAGSATTGIAPGSLGNSGPTWMGPSTASSPAFCLSSSWRP